MSLLGGYLSGKKSNNQKLLSIYLTAGFPAPEATLPLLETIAAAGADFIELGIPFSDPLADGPTIQEASQIALKNGITLPQILKTLKEFKHNHDTPVLLMGYTNPFWQYGWEKLATDAKQAGASGFIIPDLPPEECHDIRKTLAAEELDLVFLATPNTPTQRLKRINDLTNAFIYAVSITGVTGARERLPEETKHFLKHLRQFSGYPVLVGFGISGPETAKTMSQFCDGVIIGSAIINCISRHHELNAAREAVYQFVKSVKQALVT